MARICVLGTPFKRMLLSDLEKRQSLREHTINPPAQERYINPVNLEALQEVLDSASAGVVTETAQEVVDDTVLVSDVSTATIQTTVASQVLTADELVAIQDILSYRIIETGHFLLSFHGGVIRGLLNVTDDAGNATPWVTVLTEDGSGPFSL